MDAIYPTPRHALLVANSFWVHFPGARMIKPGTCEPKLGDGRPSPPAAGVGMCAIVYVIADMKTCMRHGSRWHTQFNGIFIAALAGRVRLLAHFTDDGRLFGCKRRGYRWLANCPTGKRRRAEWTEAGRVYINRIQ